MKSKQYKNISNYFSIPKDVGSAFEQIMGGESDAVFGVEIEAKAGEMGVMLVSPPYIRIGEELEHPVARLVDAEKPITCYEGYLLEPFFLPLYGALGGFMLEGIKRIALEGEDAFSMQWLFKRRTDNWQSVATDMYSSYLDGNDYPFQSRFGRGLQQKILGLLNKIASFDTTKSYVQEAEQKILSEGYQFQLRVLISSENPERIRKQIDSVLQQCDSYNALRLVRLKSRRFLSQYREVLLTHDSDGQILSRQEIASLFGGDVPAPIVVSVPSQDVSLVNAQEPRTAPEVVAKVNTPEVVKPKPIQPAIGAISLLPVYQRKDIRVDAGTVISDLADAMKRIGLIKQARLTNGSVTSGIRLTVAQCDIPKGKILSQITSKATDIQAALGVQSLGVEQGDEADTVKFTVPNEYPDIISLRELIELKSFQRFAKENNLAFIVGVDEVNNPIFLSLEKLVHLLIAGATGSGKSVFLNCLIICLLLSYTPEELRLYLIDPKRVEMQQYRGFPHVGDVLTDMDEAAAALANIVVEMENRYSRFEAEGVKDIIGYNQVATEKLAYIVCVIDEYADLKDTHPEIEEHIPRLGQLARAAGIHLVIATQRPEAKIISGRIKANIQNAISFSLPSNTDYRTVFGQGIGKSTRLLGHGDGIMKINGYPKFFQRFQSPIITPDKKKEKEVYATLKQYYSGYEVAPVMTIEDEEPEVIEGIETRDEDELLVQLKTIIADTRETKLATLKKLLRVRGETVSDLMSKLVEEGFLMKHRSKKQGYEIIADEETLALWKTSSKSDDKGILH